MTDRWAQLDDWGSLTRKAVDLLGIPHEVRTANGVLVARPQLPGLGATYELRVERRNLGVAATIVSQPLSAWYCSALRRQSDQEGPTLLGPFEDLAEHGADLKEWTIEPTRVRLQVALPPGAGHLPGPVPDLLGRTIFALLRVAVGCLDVAPLLGAPSVRRRMLGPSSEEQVWIVDPDERDRSTDAHRKAENLLIQWAEIEGLNPIDGTLIAKFDVGWLRSDGKLVAIEVKSNRTDEVHQVRLGLGQVADYRERLHPYVDVVAVLFLTARPEMSEHWRSVASSMGVCILWPEELPDARPVLIGSGPDG